MSFSRGPSAVCLTLMALGAAVERPAAVERFAAYRQIRADGAYVDWFEGHAGILGRTRKYQDLKVKPFLLEAQQAALTEGRLKLLNYLRTIPIDGTRRLGDDDALFGKIRTLLEKTPPGKSEVHLPYGVTVPIKVPLFGAQGILGAVLGETSEGPPAAPAGEQDAEAAASDGPTGLVVDASAVAGLVPALLPKIVDESGRVVYGPETADARQALLRGVAGYALRVEARQVQPALNTREGERPLRVAAVGAAGPGSVWAVVSVPDADRILKESASSQFLRNCRVLILAPPAGLPKAPLRPVPSPRTPVGKPAPGKER